MAIFSVFIVNRAGGLIYDYDHFSPKTEIEYTFSYPLEPVLKIFDERIVVAFGQRDGVKGKAPPPFLNFLLYILYRMCT